MRTMDFFWRTAQRCAFAAMMMCVVSCGGDDPIEPVPDPEPDPTPTPSPDKGEVSFVIDNEGGGGTGGTSSPAEVAKGDTLNMVISQKSSYTDSDGSVFTCEPKATIELFAKMDTVYVKDKNLLTDVKNPEAKTSQSGTSPVRNVTTQSFQIGEGQYIHFDLAYEVYKHINKANQTIEMPYVKLSQAKFGTSGAKEEPTARSETPPEITLKPIAVQTRATVIDTTMYEVNAKFSIDIESVNAKTDNKQTLMFSVTYIGVVETSTEVPDPDPELVKVEYRPSWVWEEAHDNLPLLYYAEVFRDRYYSNGEVLTDRFVDNGHPVESNSGMDPSDLFPGQGCIYDDKGNKDSLIYSAWDITYDNDSNYIYKHHTIVPDISKLDIQEEKSDYWGGALYGEWDKYIPSKLYSLQKTQDSKSFSPSLAFVFEAENNLFDFAAQDWGNSTQQDGWYFCDITQRKILDIYYGDGFPCVRLILKARFYDQFFVMDGVMVTFLDYKPEHTWNLFIEDIAETSTFGPGKKFTYECKTKFLGRNFYIVVEETIYQRKK